MFLEPQFMDRDFFPSGSAHTEMVQHDFLQKQMDILRGLAQDIINDNYWSAGSPSVFTRDPAFFEASKGALDS
jgi:hypothetical protein